MADLDVNEVIEDPLFTSEVKLISVDEQSDGYGNPEWSDYSEATIQAVVTSDMKNMNRIPDELRVDGMILVRFPTEDAPTGFTGTGYDAVMWNGRRYVVKDVADYSQFGRGFYRMVCHPAEISPVAGGRWRS
jgi:hypothetical protein